MTKTPPFFLIQSYLAFCLNKNIVAAAKAVGLSQPAMTSHLNQFEEFFEHDIFVMSGRKKDLTVFGKRLFDYFLEKFGHLENDLKQIQYEFLKPEHAQIRIGGRSEILNYYSERIHFPGSIVFEDIDGARAVEAVLSKQIDLAISNHLEQANDLIFKKILTDRFSILVPKKLIKDNLSLSSTAMSALIEKPFISYRGNAPYLDELLAYFKMSNNVKPYRTISNWLTIIKLVQNGSAWSIVPELYARNLKNVEVIPLESLFTTETHFYLFYRRELRKVEWFKNFIEEFLK